MANSFHLTGFDYVILALLFLFTFRGLWVGFFRQITTLVALVVGYGIAGQYSDTLFPFLHRFSTNPNVIFWSSYVILFGLTYILVVLLGKGLTKVVEMTVASWFDKLLGGVLGLAKAGVIIVLLSMLLAGLLAPGNGMIRDSQFFPYVDRATEFARSLIKDDVMRQAFLQQRPAISEKTERQKEQREGGVRPFSPTRSPQQ